MANLRFEWSRKRGWYKYGTRRRLFDHTDPDFGISIALFMNTYAEDLEKIFKDHKKFRGIDKVMVFTEFFGKESFAGLHKSDDPTREVMLFDVNIHKFGFLGPRDFLKIFGDLKIARKLYEGKPMVLSLRRLEMGNMTFREKENGIFLREQYVKAVLVELIFGWQK